MLGAAQVAAFFKLEPELRKEYPNAFEEFESALRAAVTEWEKANGRPIDEIGISQFKKPSGPLLSKLQDHRLRTPYLRALGQIASHLADDAMESKAREFRSGDYEQPSVTANRRSR